MWVFDTKVPHLSTDYNAPLACLIDVRSVTELSSRSCESRSDMSEVGTLTR